jgi:hypothetical protein
MPNRPLWVRLRLGRERSRRRAVWGVANLAVMAALCVAAAALWGTAGLLAALALWGWLAVRWVDRHRRWAPGG